MLMRFNDAEEKDASGTCKILEYRTVDTDAGMAMAKLDGRYPERGTSMNLECKLVYYVLNGCLVAKVVEESIEAGEGDCLIIPPNEKYFIEGQARFVIFSTPAWNPGQYEEFPE
jgi:mannose-6-phosphate isomerase-like protein (cupin superfamily)